MNGTAFQGLTLMITGVTFVLLFLTLLICLIFLMSKAVKKFNQICPEKNCTKTDDNGIIAAIVAMIKKK